MAATPAAVAIHRELTAWLFGTALCHLDDDRMLNSFENFPAWPGAMSPARLREPVRL